MNNGFEGTQGRVKVVIDGTCSGAWPHIVPADCDADETFETSIAELPTTHTERSKRGMPGTFQEKPSRFKETADHDKIIADANLIADAFNTLQETGLTPRQLAEQRSELLGLLSDVMPWFRGALDYKGFVWGGARHSTAERTYADASEYLARATGAAS